MVVNIILALCIPVSMYLGHKFTLKAYEIGLKHNYELKNNIKPSETKNIVVENIEKKVEEKKSQDFQEMINEYLGN